MPIRKYALRVREASLLIGLGLLLLLMQSSVGCCAVDYVSSHFCMQLGKSGCALTGGKHVDGMALRF
ncbi:Uncharacterized protein HZ326_23954 [Fusarium oxysporum f. sp. albedinis]|nr:Uncharacterized protein HZ326_23954 [Fusarium oxysporum f. sp. albedinis]